MIRLIRLNEIQYTESEYQAEKLVKEGFTIIQEKPVEEVPPAKAQAETSAGGTDRLDKLNVNQLKELATQNGIDIPTNAKKADIIAMLGGEGNGD